MNTAPQRNATDQASYELNLHGRLSDRQVQQLLMWYGKYAVVYGLGGLLLSSVLTGIAQYLVITITTLVIAAFTWHYGADLIGQNLVMVTNVKISKTTRRFMGPTRYELLASDGLRIRVFAKSEWLAMQEEHMYTLFYTRRTRWLLSWSHEDNTAEQLR